MRPIQATVSESALRHNFAVVKTRAPNASIMAVLKANAYGHGLFNVAQALNAADGFAVLGLNEAIDLREAGFDQRIMLLEGVFSAAELNIATSFSIDVVVHHQAQIEMLEQVSMIAPVNVYIKVNTGMNRLGFTPQAFEAAYKRLSACQNVHKITLMTHFASADAPNGIDHALKQFELATHLLSHEKTLANSASILLKPESHADWVRPGIMLYGASPVDGQTAASFDLKPAMQFTSEIISVQTLAAGQSLGYGYRYTAKAPMRIGVVACGYADGYPRHAGQYNGTDELYGAPIAVDGQTTQTVGRVSMDMMACDLTQLPESDVGSPVELWGDLVPVDAVAAASGTIGYELLCAVAPRVPLKVID